MASFGEDLKRERELRDISLEEISRATNISKSLLEALEQNNFALLPGGAYTRGFIRSYARHVGIDVEETLDAYKAEMERRQSSAGEPRPASPARPAPKQMGRIPEAAVAASLLLTAVVIGFTYWGGPTREGSPPPPDPEAHGAALRARFKRAGKLPSLPLPGEDPLVEPVPQEARPEDPPRPEPVEIEPPEILLVIRARETTRIQLSCSGRVEFDGELWVGAERHFPCRQPIVLSAANGGAVEVGAAGSPAALLGKDGERVERREITFDQEAPDPEGRIRQAATP